MLLLLALACSIGGGWLVTHPPSVLARLLVSVVGLALAWGLTVGCFAAWLPASIQLRMYAATILSGIPAGVTTIVFVFHTGLKNRLDWPAVLGMLAAVFVGSTSMGAWPVRNLIRLRYRHLRAIQRATKPVSPPYPQRYANDDTIDFGMSLSHLSEPEETGLLRSVRDRWRLLRKTLAQRPSR